MRLTPDLLLAAYRQGVFPMDGPGGVRWYAPDPRAVIPLDASEHDEVWILANNHPVARGEIEIREDRIAITVTRAADVYDFMAGAA